MRIGKTLLASFFVLLLTENSVNATVAASDNNLIKGKRHVLTEEQKARMEALKNRAAQIKAINKSTFSKADRKELRRELKDINKEAKEIGGKTFILALGGIVVVVLLLILLL